LKESYIFPLKLKDAAKILRENRKAKLVAGGTSIGLVKNLKDTVLVDITRLPLNYVKFEKSILKIGAVTKISDIIKNKHAHLADGLLIKACNNIGSTIIKNMVTAGGNCVQVYPWSDLPCALLALDGEFMIYSEKRSRKVKASTFYSRSPRLFLKKGELLKEIRIDFSKFKGAKSAYIPLQKVAVDYSGLTVAAIAVVKSKKIKFIRLAVSALKSLPFRLKEVENILVGEKVSKALIEEAENTVKRIAGSIKIVKDIKYSVSYKKKMLPVFTRRALEQILL